MIAPTTHNSCRTTPSALPRSAAIVAMSICLPIGMGCSRAHIEKVLGTDSEYIFVGQDVVSIPNRNVRVVTRLQKVALPHDVKNAVIGFFLDGKQIAEARTDEEGMAVTSLLPPQVGDYVIEARYLSSRPATLVVRTQVLVVVRNPDVPLCVADLDKTLVDAGYKTVLTGIPPAMDYAAPVMKRIARDHLVIYLTSRPELLGPKTKDWLRTNDFPRGPVFLAEVEELLAGNRRYKSRTLAGIRRDFKGAGVGFGNVKSDMLAYLDNELRAVLLVHLSQEQKRSPLELRERIHELRELPPSVQVAVGWRDVESALFDNKPLTINRACGLLEQMTRR